MPSAVAISSALEGVRTRIADAARAAGRDPDDVTLVAVSKGFGTDRVLAGIRAGLTDLGENRAQELREKMAVAGTSARWHFIGPLQTNKVRLVAGHVRLIHSVDRIGLVDEIDRRARALDAIQDVLVQVNVAGEATKHGIEPARVRALAEAVVERTSLRLRGLMTIPPLSPDPEGSRPYFETLHSLGRSIEDLVDGMVELSMGMSRDFEVAVREGATIVRVGEAIFGPRR